MEESIGIIQYPVDLSNSNIVKILKNAAEVAKEINQSLPARPLASATSDFDDIGAMFSVLQFFRGLGRAQSVMDNPELPDLERGVQATLAISDMMAGAFVVVVARKVWCVEIKFLLTLSQYYVIISVR